MMRQAEHRKAIKNATSLGRHLLAAIAVVLLTTVGAANANDAAVCRDAAEKEKWSRAVPACTAAATRGDARAQFLLGLMYNNGLGVAEDRQQALRWYTLAAEQGDNGAQFSLGLMYRDGKGVAQNYAQVVRLWTLAAEQGNTLAQNNLGILYDEGRGVVQDYAQAVRWYRLAAERGYVSAQNNLGVMYGLGRGVARDNVRAHMWLNLAAVSGKANSVQGRDLVASQMTREQIAKAQQMATDCKAKNYKAC